MTRESGRRAERARQAAAWQQLGAEGSSKGGKSGRRRDAGSRGNGDRRNFGGVEVNLLPDDIAAELGKFDANGNGLLDEGEVGVLATTYQRQLALLEEYFGFANLTLSETNRFQGTVDEESCLSEDNDEGVWWSGVLALGYGAAGIIISGCLAFWIGTSLLTVPVPEDEVFDPVSGHPILHVKPKPIDITTGAVDGCDVFCFWSHPKQVLLAVLLYRIRKHSSSDNHRLLCRNCIILPL